MSTLPDLKDHICFSIYAMQQAIGRAYQPLLDDLGLTYPQYITMVALWGEDGVTVGEIGAQVGLETNTLTPLLKRLEASGMLTRKKDRRDERRVRVHLTDQGKALEPKATDMQTRFRTATGLAGAEAKALKTWLDELRAGLAA